MEGVIFPVPNPVDCRKLAPRFPIFKFTHMKIERLAKSKMPRVFWSGCSCLLVLVRFLQPQRASAADHAEFKYEMYKEDDHRIEINTGLFQFEKSLGASTVVRGETVYDAISGASPTGGPRHRGMNHVPMAQLEDTRNAGGLELSQRWGRQTFTPQVAYSTESDYESWGVSLKDAIDFNNKNTTLVIGASHNFDAVFAGNSPYLPPEAKFDKDSTDVLLGVTQLLGPKTVLTVNGTYGYTDGYLTDPYKGIRFDAFPDVDHTFIFPEKRPGYKSREILYASLTQFITSANASVELAYRFYHDSFDIFANTVSLTWFQKVGEHLSIEPSIRWYDQSEADFYFARVPKSQGVPVPVLRNSKTPKVYSADYRLSALTSWTYGVKVAYKFNNYVSLDAAYKRYVMDGNDNATSSTAYPKAHIYTVGLTVWF